jgi:prepilin-type N-terminal cleavage/methylation domain-containing protein
MPLRASSATRAHSAWRACRVRRARGFTLVELSVSLVAGLIVALAVVALAKSATNSFYESVRLSTAEQSVRIASERLRSDLQRTGFMSTGNVKLAARDLGFAPIGQWAMPNTASGSGLTNLSSINIYPGGSVDNIKTVDLSGKNSFSPDKIRLAANFTTSDSYRGRLQGTCTGGQAVILNADADGATWRLLKLNADGATAATQAFRPVGADSYARVVDATGCQHYVVVKAVSVSSNTATVCVAPGSGSGNAVLTPASNCGAYDGSEVTINPVQRVTWYLDKNTDTNLDGMSDAASTNYSLFRAFLGTDNKPINPELIAEKVVDLKFGIVVDDPTVAARTVVYDYYTKDGAGSSNDAKIAEWTGVKLSDSSDVLADAQNKPSPHRVRSVRYRVAARAAIPDRTAAFTDQTTPFQSRYCMDAAATTYAACTRFTRLRILTSEVALTNQARMSY